MNVIPLEPLEDVTLFIPPMWEYPWEEAIDETEGETSKLLEICSNQSKLIKKCTSWIPHPMAIGWLTLWTIHFRQMQGAISLMQSDHGITKCGQMYALELIWRSSFELNLQLQMINSEQLPLLSETEDDNKNKTIKLNAYVAWSMYQDKEFASRLTQSKLLDNVWNVSMVKQMLKDPTISEVIKYLWGDEFNPTIKSTREGKKRQRINALEKRSSYMSWLKHPDLVDWFNKIRGDSQKPRDLYSLIYGEQFSIRAVMAELSESMDLFYPIYQRASSITHGTSIDYFMLENSPEDSKLMMPSIAFDDSEVESAARHVSRFSHFNAVILSELQQIVHQFVSADNG